MIVTIVRCNISYAQRIDNAPPACRDTACGAHPVGSPAATRSAWVGRLRSPPPANSIRWAAGAAKNQFGQCRPILGGNRSARSSVASWITTNARSREKCTSNSTCSTGSAVVFSNAVRLFSVAIANAHTAAGNNVGHARSPGLDGSGPGRALGRADSTFRSLQAGNIRRKSSACLLQGNRLKNPVDMRA